MRNLLATFMLLLALSGTQLKAQNIEATATANRDTISAGQPIEFVTRLVTPENCQPEWNDFGDTLTSTIELVDLDIERKTKKEKGSVVHTQKLTITSFELGDNSIPSIPLRYSFDDDDSLSLTAYTNPIQFYVRPIDVDTTQAFRDIKEPLRQPITLKETVNYTGIIIICAALVLIILFIIRKVRNKEHIIPEKPEPVIPAIVTARSEMDALKTKQLWQTGHTKEYYTELTGIARKYIEGQFGVQAVELTSQEILTNIKPIGFDTQTYEKLKETLETSDFVKFAKYTPSPEENEMYLTKTERFIEESYAHYTEEQRKKEEQAKDMADTEKEAMQ